MVWKQLGLSAGLISLVLVSFLSGTRLANRGQAEASTPAYSLPSLPGEYFIKKHMTNPNHTLKTNLKPPLASNEQIAQGNQSLSESLGLWMTYALEKGDKALFSQNVEVLRKYYDQDGWIAWKVDPKAAPVTTNALVDDLRIAEALYRAADVWKADEDLRLADEIADSVIRHQYKDGQFADFYDTKTNQTSNQLTLSYVNTEAFEQMLGHGHMTEDMYRQAVSFLQQLPTQSGFFPYSYDVASKQYHYDANVNLIDQLYIVYHRAKAGIASPDIWSFVKSEFSKRGLLYGKYDPVTKKPTVPYESPAVYGLAILAAIQLHDGEFARELYYRIIQKQIRRPENPLYGGYVDTKTMDTHIFDNLLPLLAERRLYNEGLLH